MCVLVVAYNKYVCMQVCLCVYVLYLYCITSAKFSKTVLIEI